MNEYTNETTTSLNKTQRVCKLMRTAMMVLFAVFCFGWAVSIGSIALALIAPDAFGSVSNIGPIALLLCFIYGAIAAIMFIVFIGMFTAVAKGESPFTLAQVKRLQIIAAMLVLYACVDTCVSAMVPFLQIGIFSLGYTSTSDSMVIPINLTPIIAAAVILAFSFVFKYGVLLQEFSDETI